MREVFGVGAHGVVRVRIARPLAVALLVLCAGAAASMLAAAPAHAFPTWEHDGTSQCRPCHAGSGPSNRSCQICHGTAFKVNPGYDCWTCHEPGSDTSSYAADCSQTCHVWDATTGAYDVPFTHGTNPHDGADTAPCTSCHGVSVSVTDPDSSPHHSGVTMQPPTCVQCHDGTIQPAVQNHDDVTPECTACHNGMDIPTQPAVCERCHKAKTYGTQVCTTCHSTTGELGLETVHTTTPTVPGCTTCHKGFQKHAGKVACTTCHTKVKTFHHGVTSTAGKKTCTACHSKTHNGWKIPASKCSSCHKGTAPKGSPVPQHSKKIKRSVSCRRCHSNQTHATVSCTTCHGKGFHGRSIIPTSSTCLRCHSGAAAHAVGFFCTLCHPRAVHNAHPNAGSVAGRP
jgi:hypothetical protein